jgi:MFS family permease
MKSSRQKWLYKSALCGIWTLTCFCILLIEGIEQLFIVTIVAGVGMTAGIMLSSHYLNEWYFQRRSYRIWKKMQEDNINKENVSK